VLRRPTIGVAKSKLVGEIESGKAGEDTGSIIHNGELVGAAVITKQACRPVYVSVGHMVTLKTAIQIVKHCVNDSRIPEPILRAHEIATEQKRKINILRPAKTGTK
jgi:deoxyribonuclease V